MKKIIGTLCVLVLLLTSCTMTDKKSDATTEPRGDTASDASNNSTTATTTPPAKRVAANLNTQKVVWGPGKTVEHQRPADPVALNELYSQYNAKFLMSDKKEVLMTFDEGYENGFTPSILDTLKEKGIHAVFFVTYDFVRDNPDLIRRMIAEGHTVGNHTYRHKTMDEIDLATATEEVQFLHNYMIETFQYTMRYFRFPKGEFSESSLNLVKELGYTSLFWSFAYADWDPKVEISEEAAFKKITDSTHNGAIFLLHAVSKTNAAILGRVLDSVKSQGYTFSTLS